MGNAQQGGGGGAPTETGGDLVSVGLRGLVEQQFLPEGYRPEGANDLTFDPRLAFELSLGVHDVTETFKKYGLDPAQARALMARPEFIAKVKEYKAEVTDSGLSFRLKAKLQAEDLLAVSYALVQNAETPAPVRADLIKWTAKMADLEPAVGKGVGMAGAGFSLNIMIGSGAQPAIALKTVEAEVIDV